MGDKCRKMVGESVKKRREHHGGESAVWWSRYPVKPMEDPVPEPVGTSCWEPQPVGRACSRAGKKSEREGSEGRNICSTEAQWLFRSHYQCVLL